MSDPLGVEAKILDRLRSLPITDALAWCDEISEPGADLFAPFVAARFRVEVDGLRERAELRERQLQAVIDLCERIRSNESLPTFSVSVNAVIAAIDNTP